MLLSSHGALIAQEEGGTTPITARRYWRILITANNGDPTFTSINEMQLRAVPGGVDSTDALPISRSNTVASSSYWGDGGTYAFDGNTADTGAWVSGGGGGGPHSIRVDFGVGNAIAIEEVAIWPESTSGYGRAPKDFEIQASNDDASWETVRAFSGVTGWSAFGAGGGGFRTFKS